MTVSRARLFSKIAKDVDTTGNLTAAAISSDVSFGATVYDSTGVLPYSGNDTGDQAYVRNNNRFYIWDSAGWYNVALINRAPTITSVLDSDGASSPFALSIDGTPTTITITATDSDGDLITYSAVTDANFDGLASITGSDNEFTVTPFSSDSATTTSGTITFKATDGVNISSNISTFALNFLSALWDETVLSIGTSSTNSLDNSTFIDRSTNAHTVTPTGTPVQTAFHPYLDNWSVEFDGNGGTSGSGLDFGNNSTFALGTGDFTMEFWAKLTSNAGPPFDWRADQANGNYPLFSYTGSQFTWHTNGATRITGTSSPAINQWHHVAVVRNSGTTTLYVNGDSDGNWSDTTDYLIGRARVGINAFSGGTDVDGYLSNIRVVKGTAIYTSNFTPPTEKLTAVNGTILLTCQDNRFKDNSTNGWTPTITNDPKISAFNPFGQGSEYSIDNQLGSLWFGDTDNDASIQVTDGTVTDFGTDDFTIEFWFYPSGTIATTTYTIVNGFNNPGTSGTAEFYIQTSGQNLRLTWNAYTSSWTTIAYSNTDWVPYQWTHAAFVRNGTSCKIYQNGIEVASATVASDQSFNNDFSNTRIGCNQGNTSEFRGYLADFRITKGTAVYTSSFTPPTNEVGAGSSTVYLPFDNAGIFDKTGNHTLTLVGDTSTSTSQTKFADTAMYFDGTGDVIRTNLNEIYNIGTNDFTVEFWVYPSSWTSADWDTIFATGQGSNFGGLLVGKDTSENFVIRQYGTATRVSTATLPSVNTWTHVACVRSSGTSTIYYNGTSIASASDTSNYNTTTPYAHIGNSDSTTYAHYFNGYIENLQFFPIAKYTTNFTPPAQEQGRAYQAES